MRKYLTVVFLLCLALNALSQDLHFSHYFNTPLQISPANTGHFDGAYRIGLDYKSQWNTFVSGYATFTASGDFKFIRDPDSKQQLAAGIVFFNDKAGIGELSTSRIVGSFAYHRKLGRQNKFRVGIGIGAGYIQKSLDMSNLVFDRQWTNDGFDLSMGSGEPLSSEPSLNYLDFSGGMILRYRASRDFNLNAGASLLHSFTPSESFYGELNEIGTRPILHGGAYIKIANRMHLEPAFLYTNQKSASEVIVGANLGLHLQAADDPIVFAGAWIRNTRDVIPVAGLEYKHFRFFGSYDINISQLKPVSELRGGMEFSIIYIGNIATKLERVVIPCVRF